MASTQLIRKKEATPSTVIQTIDDSQYYVFRLGALCFEECLIAIEEGSSNPRSKRVFGHQRTNPENSLIKTPRTTMVASQRVSNKEGSESLQRLAREVAGMAAVFDEANRAREEQRKIMDELHQDLLMRIQSTRDYMTQVFFE